MLITILKIHVIHRTCTNFVLVLSNLLTKVAISDRGYECLGSLTKINIISLRTLGNSDDTPINASHSGQGCGRGQSRIHVPLSMRCVTQIGV